MITTNLSRKAAAAAAVTAAVLFSGSALLQPQLGGDASARLTAIDAAGLRSGLSAGAFTLAQLPFIVTVLGLGHLLRDRSSRLGSIGTALAVLGAFGHAVFGGVSMTYVVMAADHAHRSTYAALVTDVESTPIMIFALLGLVGTVLGLLLLSIGLFRGRVGPRWLGPVLWAFLVIEFVGSSLSHYASYVSRVLVAVALLAMARVLLDQQDEPEAVSEHSSVGVAAGFR